MTELRGLIDELMLQALARTLLHFFWQGAVAGAIAFVLLRVLRAHAAATRYAVGLGVLAAMLLAFVVTFVTVAQSSPTPGRTVRNAPAEAIAPASSGVIGVVVANLADSPTARALLGPSHPGSVGSSERLSPGVTLAVVSLWVVGVLALSCRLLGGWIVARRLTTRAVQAVAPSVAAAAADIADRMRVRLAVTVLQSGAVAVPTLVGCLKPVVLLPTAALAGLSPQQLQAVLAHELAHVRRHDYLANLLQTVVETLLFYHPAVWWVSAHVRAEREHCCDDLAVEACGDRLIYVSALAELTSVARPGLALAASDGSLVTRVRRILGAERQAHSEAPPAWTALALLVVLVLSGTFGAAATERQPIETHPAQLASAPTALLEEQVAPAPPAPPAVPTPPTPPVPARDRDDVTPLPPAPPAPPALPIPPSPPAPEARGSGHISWSSDQDKVSLRWTGAFRLAADERDIEWIEEGATVSIGAGVGFAEQVVLRARPGGVIDRTYSKNGLTRPYEPDGRAFLAGVLQKLITRSGLFARDRVARLLKQGGVDAVLGAIDQLDRSSYVRRVYYTELLRQATLDEATLARVLQRVAVEISSDYERASLLSALAAMPAVTDAHRVSVAQGAKTIESDYEQRRVLSAVLATPAVAPDVASAVLDTLAAVESSHERGVVLAELARKGAVTPALGSPFIALVTSMGSSYEQRRVLLAVVARDELAEPVLVSVLRGAAAIASGHERAVLLLDLARRHALSDHARALYLAAAKGIGSKYEEERVLAALVRSERR